MKKKTLAILVSSLVLLIVIGLFIYSDFSSQSVLTGVNDLEIPLQTFQTSLDDVSFEGETVYLGSVTSGQVIPETDPNAVMICNDNDGHFILSNSHSVFDNSLILESKATSTRNACTNNYISVEGTFPEGILEVNCILNAGASKTEYSTIKSYCNV
jgi:hypothetical protein